MIIRHFLFTVRFYNKYGNLLHDKVTDKKQMFQIVYLFMILIGYFVEALHTYISYNNMMTNGVIKIDIYF